MKFKNMSRKKENIEYVPGDVLTMYNEIRCEREVYMVICMHDWYNIINLNSGETYYSEYDRYDDFVRELERVFSQIEVINNDELELVRVEGWNEI